MALQKEFLEKHEDDVVFYRIYSDCGKAVLQVETGTIYGEVCITDDDPYTYEECENPDGNSEPEENSETDKKPSLGDKFLELIKSIL